MRIIFFKIVDYKIVNIVFYLYFEEILRVGGKVYLYNKGFIYFKVVIIDDKIVFVGIVNMDLRSFMFNFEVNVFIYDEEVIRVMIDDFFEDLSYCEEFNLEVFKNRNII